MTLEGKAKDASSSSSSSTGSPPLLKLIKDQEACQLIKQGAEAKIYITKKPLFPAQSSKKKVLLKYRFPKTYRHASLSKHLTISRTIAEARALVRCARMGVATPKVVCIDEEEGILGLEWIKGLSVREMLGGKGTATATAEEQREFDEQEILETMQLIGKQLALMHSSHIIHGDLTTSNMMLQRDDDDGKARHPPILILIDFGLSINSTAVEDKAVDLYVLERAFSSTHPASERLFDTILSSYQETLKQRFSLHARENHAKKKKQSSSSTGLLQGPTEWTDVWRKFEEVRLRGRKRSMVG